MSFHCKQGDSITTLTLLGPDSWFLLFWWCKLPSCTVQSLPVKNEVSECNGNIHETNFEQTLIKVCAFARSLQVFAMGSSHLECPTTWSAAVYGLEDWANIVPPPPRNGYLWLMYSSKHADTLAFYVDQCSQSWESNDWLLPITKGESQRICIWSIESIHCHPIDFTGFEPRQTTACKL